MSSFKLYKNACQLSAAGYFDAALHYYAYIITSYTNSIQSNPLLQVPDASLDGSFVSRLIAHITASQTSRALLYIFGPFSDKYKGEMKAKLNIEAFGRVLESNESI